MKKKKDSFKHENETWSYPHNVSSGKAPGNENRNKISLGNLLQPFGWQVSYRWANMKPQKELQEPRHYWELM